MTFLIEVLNEQDILEADTVRIRAVCEKILEDFHIRSGHLNVVLVDSDTIHRYNADFLQHDYPTDVISFPMEYRQSDGHLEGEVLACSEVAQDRAKEFGWKPHEELLLYVVHGLLHLVGFDDKTEELQETMRQKEREYLSFAGVEMPHWNWDDWET
ncbi:MAG: rRNA maturation RNase YbeY [Planctomycetaceae bacterium]|jgi:probable rRNA maturation factor|nr:rRNA maturation RNase YbeY [Planctomycetaceae bacterium]